MNTLVWLLLGVAALITVHMGILLYLYRETATDSGGQTTEAAPDHERGPREQPDRTVCPACGAPNDPAYRFCRRCISDLSAGKTTASGDGPTERLGS
ncbi:zinc ribbon domain-containing protein [Natronomonas gomsonensis]|jgi:hypothetical protein|uniref:zinc ribbon domain-containing protein n=1 Tax=Natronomonas gomsonensis TaxID=1046043 RepID=UPI0020CA81B5|nr:zinc ribbon domain-containing protein [Natronomonas gomsonensis]MCY4729056.1 zinc ribbon domain-containing protein [Natronomonas gomsonensis]